MAVGQVIYEQAYLDKRLLCLQEDDFILIDAYFHIIICNVGKGFIAKGEFDEVGTLLPFLQILS